jgi:hypothetical protein
MTDELEGLSRRLQFHYFGELVSVYPLTSKQAISDRFSHERQQDVVLVVFAHKKNAKAFQ